MSVGRSFRALLVQHGITNLLALLIVPYLLHRFGPTEYGQLILAQTWAAFWALLSDYGTSFTGTQRMAACRDDQMKSQKLWQRLTGLRLFLTGLGFLPTVTLQVYFPGSPYLLAYGMTIAAAITPNWVLQGHERISEGVPWQIGGQFLVLALLVMIVRSPADLAMAALIQGSVPLVLALTMIGWWFRQSNWPWLWPTWKWSTIREELRHGFPVVTGTASSFVFTTGNLFLIGQVGDPSMAGIFAAAWKFFAPLPIIIGHAQTSVYPSLSRLRADPDSCKENLRHFLAKYLIWMVVGSGLLGIVGATLAIWILPLFLGSDYLAAIPEFQILCGTLPLIAANTVLTGAFLLNAGDRAGFGRILLLTASADVPVMSWAVHSGNPENLALAYLLVESLEMLLVLWRVYGRFGPILFRSILRGDH